MTRVCGEKERKYEKGVKNVLKSVTFVEKRTLKDLGVLAKPDIAQPLRDPLLAP